MDAIMEQQDTTTTARGAIHIRNVNKRYGTSPVLHAIDLSVRPGELFTLLGPSGSGKSTVLNVIAGFTYPDTGKVFIDDRRIDNVPIHARNIGMVFQNYSLFPHMTIEDNVRFPLQLRNVPATREARMVDNALELVQMSDYRYKYPSQLSGGQQQRIAIARAIVFQPRVLLLDEPLSALDRKLRYQLQLELRRIQRILRTTMVFVTHDQDEAFTMSDRIAILNQGEIVQIGSPVEIYEHPQSLFAAQFLGINSGTRARLETVDGDTSIVLPGGTRVAAQMVGKPAGDVVQVNIRAERASIRTQGDAPGNSVSGVIRDVIFAGSERRYVVECPLSPNLIVSVPNTRSHTVFDTGDAVCVRWDSDDLLCFDAP